MKKELSNTDIALFALYKLDGVTKKIHTEEIAWEAYCLAKERFSWQLPEFKKRGFPDKTTVRYALEQAKKKENGKLVSGRGGKDTRRELEGWQFTINGANWIKKNEARIAEGLNQKISRPRRDPSEKLIRRIKNDPLFKKFKEDKILDEDSRYMFTDMLVCAPDASIDIIKEKLDRLIANADLISEEEVLNFLEVCKKIFLPTHE